MIALYILAGFFGYSAVAGVTRAALEAKLDHEYWDGVEAPNALMLSWVWPFAIPAALAYLIGKPVSRAARYLALGGRTKPQHQLPEARVVLRDPQFLLSDDDERLRRVQK